MGGGAALVATPAPAPAMPVGLLDLPIDLVHTVVEAYMRKADAKVVLGLGVWVGRLFLGPSAMTPNGEAYKLAAERLGLVRTVDAPTWSDVVHAVRAEVGRLDDGSPEDSVLTAVVLGATRPGTCVSYDRLCRARCRHLARALLARSPPVVRTALLHDAAGCGTVDMVRLALAHGATANGHNAWAPPLGFAVLRGNVEMVRLLLEHGADRSRRWGNHTFQDLTADIPNVQANERRAILELLRNEP